MASVATDSGVTVTGQTVRTFGTLEKAFGAGPRPGTRCTGSGSLVDEADHQLQSLQQPAASRSAYAAANWRPSPVKAIVDSFGSTERLALTGSPYPAGRGAATTTASQRCCSRRSTRGRRPVEQEYAASRPPYTRPGAAGAGGAAGRVHRARRVAAHDKALSGGPETATLPALSDMEAQLVRLVRRGFGGEEGVDQLRRIPTYLAARPPRARLDPSTAQDQRR